MKEKAAYLRGLIEGLGIDETTKEGKVIKAMSELLGELAEAVDGIDEDVTRAYDQINDLSEELEDLEADLYEDDEDDEEPEEEEEDTEEDDNDDDIASEPFYEVACPNCGETVYVSEDDLDAGEANCAHCGVTFEVALEDDDEEQEEGPVQYEVPCPACGQTTVFEEDDLLDGAPKCPGCGKPLDFEVAEEQSTTKSPVSSAGDGPFLCRSAGLVCLLQPDAANVQCVVQAILGGLAEHAGLRGQAVVGGKDLNVYLIGHIHAAHGFGAQDLHPQHIGVGHTAVIQLVVLTDEGLAFISQFRCKWHRESLPIV